MARPHHLRKVSAAIGAAALTASMMTASPANAAPPAPYQIVASGLNNPRGLAFSDKGDLYVAESGTGGSGACLPNAENPGQLVCLGATGSITKITRHGQTRVVTGLPSLAGADGSSATGPTDVVIHGSQQYYVTIGLGQNPTRRAELGPAGARLGTIVRGNFSSKPLKTQADLAAHELVNNPDGSVDPMGNPAPDSNPSGLVGGTSSMIAVDAGGNTLLSIANNGRVSTIATFGKTMVPSPFGGSMPMDAVPTAVAVGPDGAFYVAQLTGFPFPAGGASIWRVVPGQAPQVYASGLSSVTDLAWDGETLYAVQFADRGLLAGPPGSLVKVTPHGASHVHVASGLMFPYGVAIRDRAAYVTTGSVLAGGGAVIKVPLG